MKGKKDFSLADKNDNPGPGMYNPEPVKCCQKNQGKSQNFFGTSVKIEGPKKTSVGPGPAGYTLPDPNVNHEENPHWTIKGKLSDKEKQNEVGPGHYTIKDKPSQGVTMKGSKKIVLEESRTPGPNHYQIKSTLDPKGVSIGEKTDHAKGPNYPGPGQYCIPNADFNHEEQPKWTIKGKYPEKDRSNDVGPGQYTIRPETSNGATMKGKRDDLVKASDTPGPNHYQMKTTLSKNGISMGKRIAKTEKVESIPGPGEYAIPEVDVNHKKKPKWTIQGKYPEKDHSNHIGPGHYEIKERASQGVSMKGKKMTNLPDSETPGPNQYLVLSPPNGQCISIGQKLDQPRSLDVPGPGQYSMPSVDIDHEENPKWTIKGRYPDKDNSNDVGPGHYLIKEQQSKGITMKGRREGELKESDTPGPCYYRIGSTLCDRGVYMGEKIRNTKGPEVPGPGEYSIPNPHINREENPHWTLQGRHPDKAQSTGLGPGQYNIMDHKSTKIPITIKGRHDVKEKADEVPGPIYNKESTLSKTHAAIITGKGEQNMKINKD